MSDHGKTSIRLEYSSTPFFLLLVIYLTLLPVFDARVGYDINVVVNNSTTGASSSWSRSQSTSVLTFQSESACKGTGTSSKYQQINELAGLSMKETTSTDNGSLDASDKMIVDSRLNWIFITETGKNYSEQYTAEINESIPTIIYNQKELQYSGKGINTIEEYKNGKDKLKTRYYGLKLSKESYYTGIYKDALIFADVTPLRTIEMAFINSTTAYNLRSLSDKYSGLTFFNGEDLHEESFMGSFRMKTNILEESVYHIPFNVTNRPTWLECCPSEQNCLLIQGAVSLKNRSHSCLAT